MNAHTRYQLKQAIYSILIGAVVAFLTTVFEGLLGLMKQSIFDYLSVPISMLYYLRKRVIV